MGMKEVVSKAKVKWHAAKRIYYEELSECCLDSIIKAKLQRKINYHTSKLREII
ncbi:hypothetical protein [Bacillus sp. EB600]|uniref:hypothetical protein n=1 Tax=Bacillus sp. EB600 TaxID=2806345 RepID=UPI00210DE0B0|nr:hypothetical protein [Bacillus sp. EB600]MCQ6279992.1 hypothetical protein [Bacillus sp. EB600]